MRFWIILGLCFIPGVAQASVVLSEMCEWLVTFAEWLIGAAYVIGAITLARMGIGATLGRFPIPNFLTWLGSMFIVGAIPLILAFVTGQGFSFDCPGSPGG